MTRDQLFALPVGTRLKFDTEHVIESTTPGVVRLRNVETSRFLDCHRLVTPDEFPAEVIPCELDASEGVE